MKAYLAIYTHVLLYCLVEPGADPGEGHRGQMAPPSEPRQLSQK